MGRSFAQSLRCPPLSPSPATACPPIRTPTQERNTLKASKRSAPLPVTRGDLGSFAFVSNCSKSIRQTPDSETQGCLFGGEEMALELKRAEQRGQRRLSCSLGCPRGTWPRASATARSPAADSFRAKAVSRGCGRAVAAGRHEAPVQFRKPLGSTGLTNSLSNLAGVASAGLRAVRG